MAWSDPGRVVDQAEAEAELLGRCAELAAVAIDRAGRLAARLAPGGRAQVRGWLPGDVERYRALSEQLPAVLYSETRTPEGAVGDESPQHQQLLGYTA